MLLLLFNLVFNSGWCKLCLIPEIVTGTKTCSEMMKKLKHILLVSLNCLHVCISFLRQIIQNDLCFYFPILIVTIKNSHLFLWPLLLVPVILFLYKLTCIKQQLIYSNTASFSYVIKTIHTHMSFYFNQPLQFPA